MVEGEGAPGTGRRQRRYGARQWRGPRLLQRKVALPGQAEFVICDQSIFYHFRRFRLRGVWHLLSTALQRAERECIGRNPGPSAARWARASSWVVSRASCHDSRRSGQMRPIGGRSWQSGARQKADGTSKSWSASQAEAGTRGFSIRPRRWVVERSCAWLIRHRRLAKDYERTVQTSETLIELAAIRLFFRRLATEA